MLQLSFNGSDQRVIAWLQSSGSELAAVLRLELLQEMIRMRDVVVEDKLSGDVLKNKTGTLRRSIHSDVSGSDLLIQGTVAVDPSASSYGYVHEYGGTFDVRAHLRRNSRGTSEVRAHSVTFPERSFLRSTLAEMAPEIVAALQDAADQWVARKNAQ